MNPEIKAAIEKEAEKYISVPFPQLASTQKWYPLNLEIRGYDFKAGAEYGYKLGLLVGKIEAYTDYNNTEFFEVLLKAEKIKLQELLNAK